MGLRKSLVGVAAVALLMVGSGTAMAGDVGDDQGWCKKQQGNSRCAGGSECSTRGRQEAPSGQAKKC